MGARASSRDTAQEPTHLSPRPLVLKPAGPNPTHPNPTCPQTHWPQPSSPPGPLIPTPLIPNTARPQACLSPRPLVPTLLVPMSTHPNPTPPHTCSSSSLLIPTLLIPNPARPQAHPSSCPFIPTLLIPTSKLELAEPHSPGADAWRGRVPALDSLGDSVPGEGSSEARPRKSQGCAEGPGGKRAGTWLRSRVENLETGSSHISGFAVEEPHTEGSADQDGPVGGLGGAGREVGGRRGEKGRPRLVLGPHGCAREPNASEATGRMGQS